MTESNQEREEIPQNINIFDIHNYDSTFVIKHLVAGSEYNLFSYSAYTRHLEVG